MTTAGTNKRKIKTTAAGRTRSQRAAAVNTPSGVHTESEDHPWTINVGNHPKRKDSQEYIKARKLMLQVAPQTGWYYGGGPYQDHHGGALWVKDEQGWFMLKNLAGIEWSAQFCADPTKVDRLRQNARRLYAKFPLTAKAFKAMGFDLDALLNTEIRDAAGVSNWTDSICNAGVPLAAPWHTGVLATKHDPQGVPQFSGGSSSRKTPSRKGPARPRSATPHAAATPDDRIMGGGVHHYPTPITDIQFFKRDDFTLWVIDAEGHPAAVVPTNKKATPAEVVYATPGSKLHKQWLGAHERGDRLLLRPKHDLVKKALGTAKPT